MPAIMNTAFAPAEEFAGDVTDDPSVYQAMTSTFDIEPRPDRAGAAAARGQPQFQCCAVIGGAAHTRPNTLKTGVRIRWSIPLPQARTLSVKCHEVNRGASNFLMKVISLFRYFYNNWKTVRIDFEVGRVWASFSSPR